MKKGWLMLVLAVGLTLSLGWSFNEYTELRKARQTIAAYQDIELLNQRSEDFVRAYVQSKHQKFLTKATAQRFAQLDNRGKDYAEVHMSDDTGLKTIDIKQLFTKKVQDRDDQAESYATLRMQYEMGGTSSPTDDYIQTLSVHSIWVKEEGQWKVNDVHTSLASDTRDDELKRQAKEALENAMKAGNGK